MTKEAQRVRPAAPYVPDGFELWRGPSAYDGTLIGVVLTHVRKAPQSRKLGDLSQAWILPVETEPLEAVRSGADVAVCGGCRFRPAMKSKGGGGCYVTIFSTAQRVWWAWQRNGSYRPPEGGLASVPNLDRKDCRIGAWGDPSAVPLEVWMQLLGHLPGWTAYTQKWRSLDVATWSWCMASVSSVGEMIEARSRGWRTYRARRPHEPLQRGEAMCPASAEASHAMTCEECGACNGVEPNDRRKDPSIIIHGTAKGSAARWVGVGPTTEAMR